MPRGAQSDSVALLSLTSGFMQRSDRAPVSSLITLFSTARRLSARRAQRWHPFQKVCCASVFNHWQRWVIIAPSVKRCSKFKPSRHCTPARFDRSWTPNEFYGSSALGSLPSLLDGRQISRSMHAYSNGDSRSVVDSNIQSRSNVLRWQLGGTSATRSCRLHSSGKDTHSSNNLDSI